MLLVVITFGTGKSAAIGGAGALGREGRWMGGGVADGTEGTWWG